MNFETHIKEIENLLNKEKIIKYKLLQVSFDIACIKIELLNNIKYIIKFYIKKNKSFNAIKSETDNLVYLNKKKLSFFPNVIKKNNNYLIIQFFENDNDKPKKSNQDLIKSIVQIHKIKNNLYGFDFNTQMGGLKKINEYEKNWVNFYVNKRFNTIFELANKKANMGRIINKKLTFILNNMNNFIPQNPSPNLLHGDLWEGNILFKEKKFVGFIDPGSFFGHSEMEVAYLRWFNPPFVDSKFLDKYNDYITLDKNYLNYEPIYQLYYALCNVALWDKSYIKEVNRLLTKLGI
tara:strand:+ start:3207 stop:4082 length:876 start_codon:yes stop_codon:yes gene_type:complete